MDWRRALNVGSTIAITACAIAVTAVVLMEHIDGDVMESTGQEEVDGWWDLSQKGHWLGPSDADIVITEFMDFTCPFCKEWATVVDSLRNAYPNKLAVAVHHFPLDNRKMARPAAIAAECAAEQGRFEQMYEKLYEHQEELGDEIWGTLAEEAGIEDISAFEECVQKPADSFPRIDEGRTIGEQHGVRATPTVWINGRPLRGQRSVAAVEAAARDLGVGIDRR